MTSSACGEGQAHPFVQVARASFLLLPNIAGFGSDTKRVESPTFLKTMVVKPFLRPPVEDDSPLEPLGPAALQEALNAVAPALKRTTASDPRSRDRDQKRDVVKAGEPFGIGSSLFCWCQAGTNGSNFQGPFELQLLLATLNQSTLTLGALAGRTQEGL